MIRTDGLSAARLKAPKFMHLPATSASPILLLASLSLFWGLNWPGMKIILSEMTVWWFRALCLIVGGCILLLISALSGNRWQLRTGEFRPVLICGTFAILGWMVFSAYGVSLMPAGRASIIAFTMPLWATLIAAFVLGERINSAKIAGLFLDHLRERLSKAGFTLTATPAARRQIADRAFNRAYGAREIGRAVQRLVEDPIAERILQGEFNQGQKVRVASRRGELLIEAA